MSSYVNYDSGEIKEAYKGDELKNIRVNTDGKDILVELDGDMEWDIKARSPNSPKLSKLPYPFCAMNNDMTDQLLEKTDPKLTNGDWKVYTGLGGSLNYDGIVIHKESGLYMIVSEMANKLDMDVRTLLGSFSRLEKHDILKRFNVGRNTHVRFNPWTFYRGYSNNYSDLQIEYNQMRVEIRKGKVEKPNGGADSVQ